MRSVLFRVDGSLEIGLGHIMRCLAIAQEFKQQLGLDPIFALKYYDKKVSQLIKRFGFNVREIGDDKTSNDALSIEEIAQKYKAKIIIMDLSHAAIVNKARDFSNVLKELKGKGYYLVVIDGGLEHDCISLRQKIISDMVIIPYFDSEKIVYKLNKKAKALLGPDYFVFRNEFRQARKRDKRIKKNIENILLTMGGSDPFELTPKIVKFLIRLGKSSLSIHIIQGLNFSSKVKNKIKELRKEWDGNYNVLNGTNNMADLMNRCDMAIINKGLTQYEAAFIGIPYLAVTKQDFNSPELLASKIKKIFNNVKLRRNLSKKRKQQLDGKGVNRIIEVISKDVPI